MTQKRRLWLWILLGTIGSLIVVGSIAFFMVDVIRSTGRPPIREEVKAEPTASFGEGKAEGRLGEKSEEAGIEITREKPEEGPTVSTEKKLKISEGLTYEGKKIILKEYEIVKDAFLSDRNEKELYVYLYVENVSSEPHSHIYDFDFVLYHKGREAMILFAPFSFEREEGYDTGEYADLRPGEVREGWISTYIPLDWQTEDMEIHFEPIASGTIAIWKLGEELGAQPARTAGEERAEGRLGEKSGETGVATEETPGGR